MTTIHATKVPTRLVERGGAAGPERAPAGGDATAGGVTAGEDFGLLGGEVSVGACIMFRAKL